MKGLSSTARAAPWPAQSAGTTKVVGLISVWFLYGVSMFALILPEFLPAVPNLKRRLEDCASPRSVIKRIKSGLLSSYI